MRLSLHLPDEQSIMFKQDLTELEEPGRLEFLKETTLTSFFDINSSEEEQLHDPSSRDILYQDLPEYYTWIKTKRKWKRRTKRQRNPTIGRIQGANFRQTERWCLRKLLLRISGPTSFENLRTVHKSEDINFNILTPLLDLDHYDNGIVADDTTNQLDQLPQRIIPSSPSASPSVSDNSIHHLNEPPKVIFILISQNNHINNCKTLTM